VIPPLTPTGCASTGSGAAPAGGSFVLLQAVRSLPGSARPARRAARRTSLGCGPLARQGLTAVTSPPAAPATLKCEFIPALTGGFLLAPLSLNQAQADERALPCSPTLTRSYLGPAGYAGTGGAAVGPRSGSGEPDRAGLSEP